MFRSPSTPFPRGSTEMGRRVRTCAVMARWFVAGAVAVLIVVIGSALGRGGHILVVASGSMTPTMRTGDVIVVTPVAPAGVRVGQVVTFRDPTRHNRIVSHRVRAV